VFAALRKRIKRSVFEAQSRLVDVEALEKTLQRLVADGDISERDAGFLGIALRSQLDGSRYILSHLGAHLAIGAVFAFDLVPIPLGTIYLLPLRRQSTELAFILANHTWLSRTGCSYEQFLGQRRSPVRRFARWLVPLPEPREQHAA
jgi:hypothetical protein